MEPFALTISQAAALGGPCRSALYEDIRRGRLRAVKRGRSTRILIEDFRKYLTSLPTVQPIVGITRSEDEPARKSRARRTA